MGPTCVLSAPYGPHIGPINLAIGAGDGNNLFLSNIYTPIVTVANHGVLDDMLLLFIISC